MLAAIRDDDAAAVGDILDKAPDAINKRLKDGSSNLHHACSAGSAKVVALLVKKGADVIACDSCNRSPLHCAAEKGQLVTLDLVLQKLMQRNWQKRIINMLDSRGMNCVHLAASHHSPTILKKLLAFEPDLDAQQKGTLNTPLIIACCCGAEESVSVLCEAGAGVNCLNSDGRHALSFASENGQQKVVEILFRHGGDATCQDVDKQTAAHWAFCMEHFDLGKWLLSNCGADLDLILDADGKKPSDWLAILGSEDQDADADEDKSDVVERKPEDKSAESPHQQNRQHNNDKEEGAQESPNVQEDSEVRSVAEVSEPKVMEEINDNRELGAAQASKQHTPHIQEKQRKKKKKSRFCAVS